MQGTLAEGGPPVEAGVQRVAEGGPAELMALIANAAHSKGVARPVQLVAPLRPAPLAQVLQVLFLQLTIMRQTGGVGGAAAVGDEAVAVGGAALLTRALARGSSVQGVVA